MLSVSVIESEPQTSPHEPFKLAMLWWRVPVPKNPPWTRDELILALDLYFKVDPIHTSEKHPEILALSKLLNSLPAQGKAQDVERFRISNVMAGQKTKLSELAIVCSNCHRMIHRSKPMMTVVEMRKVVLKEGDNFTKTQ